MNPSVRSFRPSLAFLRSRTLPQFLALACLFLGPSGPLAAAEGEVPAELQTVAEASDYKATATHAQVLELCGRLAARSARVTHVEFGRSHEGKSLPLLILADPPLTNAAAVRSSGKLVVFAMANIHAGEVCGKEALLMLAREASEEARPGYLDQLVVLVAPIYNADGNDRMAADNRPGQLGPEQGMGERENAQGLDLNRDHVKLESPEARALVGLLNAYDPAIMIDCHTTNGSAHQYTITYDSPRHPAVPRELVEYGRDNFLLEVGRRLERRTGYRSFYYGNFDAERKQWETYPAWPRYNTQYNGLRGRLGILSEAYAYAPFKDRVLATKGFVEEILGLASERHEEIQGLIKKTSVSLSESKELAIASEATAIPGVFPVLGYAPSKSPPFEETKGSPQTYQLTYLGGARGSRSVQVPKAYLLPATLSSVMDNLHRHGIQMEVLREDLRLDVEEFIVREWKRADGAYQNHNAVTAQIELERATRLIPAGTVIVRTDQPLAGLVVNLLEPAAEDGLVAWNFLDDFAKVGAALPYVRCTQDHPWLSVPYRDPAEVRAIKKRPVSVEDVMGPKAISWGGAPADQVVWLEDETDAAAAPNGNGGSEGASFPCYAQYRRNAWWRIEADTGRATPLFDQDGVHAALAEAMGRPLPEVVAENYLSPFRARYHSDMRAGIVTHAGDLFAFWTNPPQAKRLTNSPAAEELARFSPDGKNVAFIQDFDLYVVGMDGGAPRRLTFDGTSLIRHGKADWVYFEEVYNRDWSGYQWSPDSQWIALLEYNDSQVRDFFVLNHLPPRGELETERYPKSGDPIPQVRLGIVNVRGGEVRWKDFEEYTPGNLILTRYGWTPDSGRILVCLQDRAQKWLDLRHLSRSDMSMSPRARITGTPWVPDPEAPTYLPDGSFLLFSETSGWRHIEHWRSDGTRIAAVTSGDWEVKSILGLDRTNSWVYFTATKDNLNADHLYRVRLDGSELRRLTPAEGDHRVSLAPGGGCFLDTVSDLDAPARVVLRNEVGEPIRTVDTNPVAALNELDLRPVERVAIPLKSGFVMRGTMILPAGINRSAPDGKKYPVWIMTYGGPHAPTVREGWQQGRGMERLLASMGIIAFRCDPESASGAGSKSVWGAYQQLGVRETADMDQAAEWLSQQPFVDATRIGLSGHSYGGYLTAYVLTHSDKFAAGISGAPVTDWRNYDAFYTERYMNTPQENPDGYQRSSVLAAAGNLHGKLLLIHGAMDDNVHLQNTLQLAQELQRADRDFEMMIYPTSRHGIFGSHYQNLQLDFIRRTMLGAP